MQNLLKDAKTGNIKALAKLISSLIEGGESDLALLSELYDARKQAHVVGITGPPGAGKSTLTNVLISRYRKRGCKVGVLAIDPSSPFTGGALLGDRIRMLGHAEDKDVFIRSLGSRGMTGGLARHTEEVLCAYAASGFHHIIVETVGVGQTELGIMELADTSVVVLVPESGDTIQTMKSGLLEAADIFVVNKADREGASQFSTSLRMQKELNSKASEWDVPILLTQALHEEGIDELFSFLQDHEHFVRTHPEMSEKKKTLMTQSFLDLLRDESFSRLLRTLERDPRFQNILHEMQTEQLNPYQALEKVLALSSFSYGANS